MQNLKNLLFLLSLGLLAPAVAQAIEFNPHNIISDEELQDYQSLGKGEIRSFLENRNSALVNLIVPDYEGKNRYASDIIYKASQDYKINPKYLLVKLQKEQSLITSKNPTERQLNWATGYGVCDSCDSTDPRLEKYKGFGKQVDNAAGIMRWYYDNAATQNWIKEAGETFEIDGQPVTPTNNATAFLYTYTPHLQGNQNFAKLWSTWFAASYPNGTLLKSHTNPTVYALLDGQKRPVKSMSVLQSRFNAQLIVPVSEAELQKYPEGPALAFRNFSILRIGSEYYLLDYDVARPFASADVVKRLGYADDEIIDALPMDLSGYTIGEPISLASVNITGRLVRIGDSLYYLKDNGYYSLPDPAIAQARFPGIKAETLAPEFFTNLSPLGQLLFPDASLVGSKLTKAIYVIENGKKRLIPNEIVFTALGYQWKNVVWANDVTLQQHPTGETVYYDIPTTASTTISVTGTKTISAATANTFTKQLTKGSSGPEVLALQKLLQKHGYLTVTPNGYYGAGTTAAVKKFQIANTINPVGYVGIGTRAALNTLTNKTVVTTAPTPTITTPKYRYFSIPTDTTPIPFTDAGIMYAVTSTEITTSGPVFHTDIDTYLVATLINGVPEIVAGKNIDAPRPLASLTKVVTADLLFKNQLNVDLATTYSRNKHAAPAEGNPFPVAEGDVIMNKDLLMALLASSFNQAAEMLVDATGQTSTEFIANMNATAQAQGLHRTYFYDAHGYNPRNQSTAREYMNLFLNAANHPELKKYLAIPQYSYDEIFSADKQIRHSDLNTNRLLVTSQLPYTITATKTGYLYEAGFNLAMTVTRSSDGAEFFILTMGNPNYSTKYSETDRLTKWALARF